METSTQVLEEMSEPGWIEQWKKNLLFWKNTGYEFKGFKSYRQKDQVLLPFEMNYPRNIENSYIFVSWESLKLNEIIKFIYIFNGIKNNLQTQQYNSWRFPVKNNEPKIPIFLYQCWWTRQWRLEKVLDERSMPAGRWMADWKAVAMFI